MGEYERKQRKQRSRTISNNEFSNRQINRKNVIQKKDDMRCKASIFIRDEVKNGQATNDRWKAADRKIILEGCPIIYNEIKKATNQTQDPNMNIFGCAEPGAVADAVSKMSPWEKREWDAQYIKVYVDDTIMIKNFPRQNLHIGDVKPRCVNCRQWIPGHFMNLISL